MVDHPLKYQLDENTYKVPVLRINTGSSSVLLAVFFFLPSPEKTRKLHVLFVQQHTSSCMTVIAACINFAHWYFYANNPTCFLRTLKPTSNKGGHMSVAPLRKLHRHARDVEGRGCFSSSSNIYPYGVVRHQTWRSASNVG